MNLEQFYCHKSELENVDEYFHLLKSQIEHKGNCTKENYPGLKCEFEDLIHKFLVYKFGEVGFKLSINCPWSTEVCHACFFKTSDLNVYVSWYDGEPENIVIEVLNEMDRKSMFYISKPIDVAILEFLKFIDKK